MSPQVHTLYSFGLTSEAADISRDATAAHPECIDLWLQRLKCVCSSGVPSSGSSKISLKRCREVCEEALENIPYEVSTLLPWAHIYKHLLAVNWLSCFHTVYQVHYEP